MSRTTVTRAVVVKQSSLDATRRDVRYTSLLLLEARMDALKKDLLNDARLVKFVKMMKVGVPVDNVCLKLRAEGFTEAEIAKVGLRA